MPGPARFVEAALDKLLDVGCLLVELPERLHDGFARSFATAVRCQDICILRKLNLSNVSAVTPGELIARCGLPPGVAPGLNVTRDLARHPDLENELLWVEGMTKDRWRQWDIFLRAFARERAASPLTDPYSLVLVVPPGIVGGRDDVAVRRWTGALRRADTALFVAESMIGRETALDRRIAEDVVIELAGWNLDLAERLANLSDVQLADPIPWLRENAHLTPSDPEEKWDGNRHICSFALAARGDENALNHRLWRAHLVSVFPLLESVRINAVQQYHARLAKSLPWTTPWQETLQDPEQLEVAHILNLIGESLGESDRTMLLTSKNMRNRLAHRRPVDPQDLQSIAVTQSRLLRG